MNGDLPSGQQAEDTWKHLQDQLWFLDRKQAQRKRDLAAANEARKASSVVIDEGKADKTELGTRSAVASKWLSGQEQAEAAADDYDMTTATTGGEGKAEECFAGFCIGGGARRGCGQREERHERR